MSIIYCDKHDKHFDSDFEEDCPKCEEECEHCGGEGEVAVDVLDPDSMRYMAGVGSQPCICRLEN